MRLQLEPHFLLKMKKKYTTVKLHIKNGSIISVVGKSTVEIMEPFLV